MRRESVRSVVPGLLLALAAFALYARTGAFEFVRLDDHDYTFLCPFTRDGFSWENAKTAFASFAHAGIWMPLTYVTYMLDVSFFGKGMGAHHLVNAFLHAVNAALVYGWVLRVARSRVAAEAADARPACGAPILAASLAAAFWAFHPQRVEAVAWIAARKELLWTAFTLFGLGRWLCGGWRGTLVACASCACACLSKPTAMCWPVLVTMLELARAWPADARAWRRLAVRTSPFWAMGLVTGAIAVHSQGHAAGYDAVSLFSVPFWWRALNGAVSAGLGLAQVACPVGFHVDYRACPGAWPLGGAWGLAAFAAACAGAAWVCRRAANRRAAWAAAGLFVAALIPVSGVFGRFGASARADRFFYAPAVVLSVAMGAWLAAGFVRLRNHPARRFSAVAIGAVALGCLVAASHRLVGTWRNDHALFSRVVACDPDHPRGWAHVASEECARFKDLDAGIAHFRRSLALADEFDVAAQLAFACSRRGREEDLYTIRKLGRAWRDRPDAKGLLSEALGTEAMYRGEWALAERYLTAALVAPKRFWPTAETRSKLRECRARAKAACDGRRAREVP